MTRSFTGWHMAASLIAFFGVVIAVNILMARFAIGSFGGTVVDNSYVASQNYNDWLAEAEAQAKLGWTTRISLDPQRRVILILSKNERPLSQVTSEGVAIHPLGRAASMPLTFQQTATGQYRSIEALPAGRWRVQLTLRHGSDMFKLREPVA
jgi:nitrogen fixation protein FixH